MGLSQTSATNASSSSTDSQKHAAGRKIYNFRCYFCHGYSGDAKTLAASFLDPKPRNFQKMSAADLSRKKMLKVVTHGAKNTAMQSFANTLSAEDIELVVDFVRVEFIQNKASNTRYHTKENGWDKHERYQVAFPFATGEIALDTLDADLTDQQLRGKNLFMSSCITCHDRARTERNTSIWQAKAVSYPRNQYSHKEAATKKNPSQTTSAKNTSTMDADSGASVYARHDIAPTVGKLSAREKAGETLFQANCAFCHGADGSGKNWIGSFLQPSPRNLTRIEFMQTMTKARLQKVIEEGLENTSMPAWKNVLSAAEIENVILYVFKAFPGNPLPSKKDAVKNADKLPAKKDDNR